MVDHNDFYNCPPAPAQAHGVTANPLFVNVNSD
jgi:hypothetical protein